jgi:phosphoglycerate dehydrogenase-like enzyme
VFINTGRGAQVVEEDLARALIAEPGRTALLDVTYPEPPAEDSLLRKLDNVLLTPHIAGSMGAEVARMGEYMVEECRRYVNGEPLQFEVTPAMLPTMA